MSSLAIAHSLASTRQVVSRRLWRCDCSQEILLSGVGGSEVGLLVDSGGGVSLLDVLLSPFLGLLRSSASDGSLNQVILLVLVLVTLVLSAALLSGLIVVLGTTNASIVNLVLEAGLLALALLSGLGELGHGVVLLSGVGGVHGGHVHGLVGDLGELLLFLLFLQLALFLLGTLQGFLFGALKSGLLDFFLQTHGTLVQVVDVHQNIGGHEQDERDNEGYTSTELDGHLGRRIREDEDGDDQS